jgi:type I restriction enzyme M protein
MLDATTRKRIDDCRDILVGKLPDPKAQIEQITIGLIYKFMDDMDKEAIDLGGSAKFFSGDYEKYAWDKLFDTKVTATEMLRLYSDAIESMEKNPNIPQLFRDIFNNAYLPYRDPETLKLFLKTIGEFEYTHSEKLGDAFEYLLSVMGSQGDAGQFRTPRHIIDFLVAIVDPDKGETILDPACGTAGFLISAYKHILLKHTKANKEGLNIYEYNKLEKKPFNNLGDALNPDDRRKLIQNFAGYDISPDMVRLSLVNLYLHGFSDPHISEYDTLSSEDRWNENFDVVLANPPFMSPKGGIRPHKKFTIASNRSEVLFVDYIAEHLNPKGKAGIIVPEGVIFQSGTAYKALRKMLVEDYLYAVVSLPAGVFNPYSGVKTSILLMDKALARQRKEILFVKIDNDGYNLGAQRTAVKGSQLEEAIALIHSFCHPELVSGSVNEMLKQVQYESFIAHAVLRTEIAANGDYNLSGDRYRTTRNIDLSDFPHVTLGECCNVLNGSTPSKHDETYWTDGTIPWFTIEDIRNQGRVIKYTTQRITEKALKETSVKLLPPNTVLLCCTASVGEYAITEIPLTTNQQFNGLIVKDDFQAKMNPRFLYHLSSAFKDELLRISGQTSFNFVSVGVLKTLQIPLPPISIQEEIVAEIEGYQKIIDGAKAVVAHYKPKIDINPDWEMVELGEVCEKFQYGSSKKSLSSGEVVCLRMGNIQNGEIEWSDLKFAPRDEDFEKYLLEPGDVLFNRTNSPVHVGKTGIYRGERKSVFAGYLIRLKYRKDVILGDYLNYCLNTNKAKEFCQRVKTDGINQSNINAKVLATFQIPLPKIETQRQIVAQIEKEQALVNANKQLIEIFEQKIKDRIAKVWGVEKTEEATLSRAAEPATEYLKN